MPKRFVLPLSAMFIQPGRSRRKEIMTEPLSSKGSDEMANGGLVVSEEVPAWQICYLVPRFVPHLKIPLVSCVFPFVETSIILRTTCSPLISSIEKIQSLYWTIFGAR